MGIGFALATMAGFLISVEHGLFGFTDSWAAPFAGLAFTIEIVTEMCIRDRYDIDRLVTLLREDAVQSMPPFAMWIRGAADIGRFMVEPGPSQCRGSRLLATSANGCPAFGQYKPDPDGGYTPWALQVLEISAGEITGMQFFLAFLDPERLFPAFGLPLHLDA